MSANILDGLAVSKSIRAALAERVEGIKRRGVDPRLDVIVASQDPASLAYVRMKRRWGEQVGIVSHDHPVSAETTQAELMELVHRLNADPSVHGVLVQHPLPSGLDEMAALSALDPAKDVDGITPASMGLLFAGLPGHRAATPLGIIRLLEHYEIPFQGKRALVVGRSFILGKPAAMMLLEKNATVTIAHSRSEDLPSICREADILVAAVGRPEMIRGDWLKPGAVVIDAGYNKVEGRTSDVGDVNFDEAAGAASWITPVPGGVGPMTIATLLSNVVDATEMTL